MSLDYTLIPTQWVGEIAYSGFINEALKIPLATYESPLWPSVNRGARISRLVENGVQVNVFDSRMSRSLLFSCDDAATAINIYQQINNIQGELQNLVSADSRFAKLLEINPQIVGNLLFLRLEFSTGDASGHNMVTKAADAINRHLLQKFPQLSYGSISGNYCCDKKVSAVNGILGRGHYVIAEILIPEALCQKQLRCDAQTLVLLNERKNLIGSNIAGSLRSANAHFANMLLAFYLATGQDAANIIEGSQGIVHCENRNGDLYFSCTLPNLIVGSVGNGKGLPQIEENLRLLGCKEKRSYGENAKRLAALCAGVVLCGELSLLAAQSNPGELMRAHLALERGKRGH